MRDLWTRRRSDFLVVGFLLLLTTVPFADVLFGYRSVYIRDLTRYYYPTKRIIREVIRGGEFPFWNRYYSAGQPMASNPEYEVFYPPQWLVLLPNYNLGYRLHILVHIWIAVIGMYAFLRSLQLRQMASAFGAIMFALGGLVVSMINLLPILFCMVWMPLIFLYTRRFLLQHQLRDFVVAVLFLGIQMLTAEPTTLVQTWFLMGLYGLYRAWYAPHRIKGTLKHLGQILALGVCGALVGAVQLIPAIEHAHESARSRPFDWALVSAWSLHPARPLELIFPTIFGYVDKQGSLYWASSFYKGTGSPFIFNFYFGLLGAALIAAAFVVRPRGGRFVVAICAVSYLIALGAHTPLLRFLYDHHIASSLRYFEKFSLMGLFSLMVLAAFMAERALDGDRRLLRTVFWFISGTIVIAAAMFIFSRTPYYTPAFRHMWGTGDTETGRRMIATSGIDWGWAVLRGAIALGVVMLVERRRFGVVAACATAVWMMIDLSVVTYSTLPRMPRRFFTPPPVTQKLDADQQAYRIFHEADWYNSSDVAKKYFSTGDAIYWIVRNGVFPMTTATWGYSTILERDYDKTALIPTIDLVDSMWKVRDAGQTRWPEIFMAMGNGRYRGTWIPLEEARKQCGGDFKKADPISFLDEGATPRYFFANRLLRYKSLADFQKQLIAGAWQPGTVFVTGEPFVPASAVVDRVIERANSARIEVTASGRSFLYMSVTPHKYWRAWIDGREAPLVVANVGFQGIDVPAGHHVVTMRYRNTLAVKMFALSSTSALIFILIAFVPRGVREPEELSEEPTIAPEALALAEPPEESQDDATAETEREESGV